MSQEGRRPQTGGELWSHGPQRQGGGGPDQTPRSCLDRGTTGVPRVARAEAQTVAPGARSTVVRGHLGPAKSRAPVSAASGTVQPGCWEGAWEGARRFFSAQSNVGQQRGSSGREATAYGASCTFDLGLCVGAPTGATCKQVGGLPPGPGVRRRIFPADRPLPGDRDLRLGRGLGDGHQGHFRANFTRDKSVSAH